MSFLFEAIQPLQQVIHVFNHFDEDGVDRMNYKYSTLLFIMFAVAATANQYVGEKIKCWAPAQFADHWIEYTNEVCWISNTYYIPMSETNVLEARRKEIVYYQWVPLALFTQSIMFYLPSVFWSMLNRSIGMDMSRVVKTCREMEHLNPDSRDNATKFLVKHLDRSLQYTRQIRVGGCTQLKTRLANLGCFCGKRYGNYLIVIYIITKLFYIGNVVAQLYLMNDFLGTDYTFYGIEILKDIKNTGGYKESRRFPRVTLCDFEQRTIGRNIPYTVQCTLPVNIFNEKMFIFIWFWLAFVGIIDILSFFSWLWILFATNRRNFVKTHLKVHKRYNKRDDRDRLIAFCDKYLRQDGHFAMRMIGKNTNEVVVGEMVTALWDHFGRNYNYHRKMVV